MSKATSLEKPVSTDRDTLAARFRAFLPEGAVVADEEGLRPYECDGLFAIPEQERPVISGGRICAMRR